ncbi:MAG TPA: PKD domain-containing protein [Cytophagaceae bacterium]|jgi:hypothetical protein
MKIQYFVVLLAIFCCRLLLAQTCPSGSIQVSGNQEANSELTFSFKTNSTLEIKTIFWEFGDGTISKLEKPTHKYATEGDFKVTVNINNCFTNELVVNSDFEEKFSPEEMEILRNPYISEDRLYINTVLAKIYGFQTQHNYCYGFGGQCSPMDHTNNFRVGTKFTNTTAEYNYRGDRSLNVERG